MPVLSSERAEYIVQELSEKSVVTVKELSKKLSVSPDTIRRDLKSMEAQGQVKCVRGGARLLENDFTRSVFSNRDILNVRQKRQAAKKAVRHIKNSDIVTMNSGTTNRIIAEELLKTDLEFTVVTNNLAVVTVLLQCPSIHVIVTGGFLDPKEKSMYGHVCENEIAKYNADICFLSVNAVDLQRGYTDFRLRETDIMRVMMKNAQKSIAVMDSSKFERVSKQHVFSAEEIDLLITDNEASAQLLEAYAQNGIVVE